MGPKEAPLHKSITLLGVRLSAVLETCLLLGLLVLIDVLFFDGNRFQDVSPHPYWLAVLLITFHYGSREGILAASGASFALLLFAWPTQEINQDFYDYLLGTLRLPLLWFVASVVFGELRMRHIAERRELQSALDDSEDHADTLAKAYERVRRMKEHLETRVASQLQTTTRMYQAAQAIDKLNPEEVLSGVTDIVRAVMNPEKFSVFTLRQGRLEAIIQDGWSAEDHLAVSFPSETPLFQAVIGRQQILCSVQEGDERFLADQGLVAGPLIQPNGDVLGMLKIEKLGFLRLTTESLANFRVVCEWIATAYGQAVRFQEAERDRVLDSDTHLYSYNFLDRQTDYVATLARRLGFDVSLVTVALENPHELDEETLRQVPGVLRDTVGSVLRRTDLAFHESEGDMAFAILLPGTPIEKAKFVIQKLRAGLAEATQDAIEGARFAYGVRAVHEYERPSLHLDKLFPRQTDFLSNLARRFGFAISMVVVRVTNTGQVVDEDRDLVPGTINRVLAEILPKDAPVFTYQRNGWEYPVVLPGTPVEQAQCVGDDLVARAHVYLSEGRSRAELSVTVQALSHERTDVREADVIHA
jgi:hypothetical protein